MKKETKDALHLYALVHTSLCMRSCFKNCMGISKQFLYDEFCTEGLKQTDLSKDICLHHWLFLHGIQ